MAGGTWTSQNKVRPGAYINVNSDTLLTSNTDNQRGVVFWIHAGSFGWGADGVTTVTGTENLKALFGADTSSSELAPLAEILKGFPEKVLVFNSNSGAKATGTNSVIPWTISAKFAGDKGNSIKVVIYRDATDSTKIDVATYFGASLVNTQSVLNASELIANDYVDFAVSDGAKADDGRQLLDAITSTLTVNLTGGTTVVSNNILNDINNATSTLDFTVLTAAGAESTANVHMMVYNTVKSLREKEGVKVTGVVPYSASVNYDYEGITVVKNGVVLEDGTQVTPTLATGYVAAASAQADVNESLTYSVYPGAVDVSPRYSNSEIESALTNGFMVFTARRDGSVVIEQDINSHHTYTAQKNQYFRKNRVLRVLDAIANDTKEIFESQFNGKVDSDDKGRDIFKANRITYLTGLQAIGAIQNFEPDDISVAAGVDKDAVVVSLSVQPTDSMEKLYATITVN